jgi:hypothetical protein
MSDQDLIDRACQRKRGGDQSKGNNVTLAQKAVPLTNLTLLQARILVPGFHMAFRFPMFPKLTGVSPVQRSRSQSRRDSSPLWG